jgi:hypothetical protein
MGSQSSASELSKKQLKLNFYFNFKSSLAPNAQLEDNYFIVLNALWKLRDSFLYGWVQATHWKMSKHKISEKISFLYVGLNFRALMSGKVLSPLHYILISNISFSIYK